MPETILGKERVEKSVTELQSLKLQLSKQWQILKIALLRSILCNEELVDIIIYNLSYVS